MATIGLTYDLRSDYLAEGYGVEDVAEFDSDSTIEAIESTIRSLGHATDRIGHARALCKRLVAGDRWDLVFNIAEGLRGRCREAQVPAILELYDVPYALSDPLVCAVTLDKAVAKQLVRAANLRTPEFFVVRDIAELNGQALRYPLFVKPLAEGTGKGIDAASRIEKPDQLAAACRTLLDKYRQPVLVEEYLPGREFTTAVIGTGGDARVIGTMEVHVLPSEGKAIYSYEMKEKCEKLVRYSAPQAGPVRKAVEDLALRAHVALECRDVSRVDIRLDAEGLPSFIEVNPLPGMHPTHSDLPMIATQEGMTYKQLISGILQSAMKRA